MKPFYQRTKRKWVEEIPDGHCGIRSMWRQDTSGEEIANIDSKHIRKGRDKLASALRSHSSSIVNVIEKEYGTGCIASQEIEDQAKRHLDCDASKTCDSSCYVCGFHGLDLIALAMETNRAVYMIRMDCNVEVYEPFKAPYAIELKDASPSEEVTVMIYTGNHFNSCIASTRIKNKRVRQTYDVAFCKQTSKGASGKCGKHGGRPRCGVANSSSLARGMTGVCGKHGGGPRCGVANSSSLARTASGKCGKHGGGPRCGVANCSNMARGKAKRYRPAHPDEYC